MKKKRTRRGRGRNKRRRMIIIRTNAFLKCHFPKTVSTQVQQKQQQQHKITRPKGGKRVKSSWAKARQNEEHYLKTQWMTVQLCTRAHTVFVGRIIHLVWVCCCMMTPVSFKFLYAVCVETDIYWAHNYSLWAFRAVSNGFLVSKVQLCRDIISN